MKTKKTIVAGTAIAGALLGSGALKAGSDLFEFSCLGSGFEVRTRLLSDAGDAIKYADLACGEKKDDKQAKPEEAKPVTGQPSSAPQNSPEKNKPEKPKKPSDDKKAKKRDEKYYDGKSCGGHKW